MIKLRNLTKTYMVGNEEFKALDNVSLDIEKGEFIMIIGESGSGKSTLLQILALLDEQYEGEYYLKNYLVKNVAKTKIERFRQDDISLLLQENSLLPFLSVSENVFLPLHYKHCYYSKNKVIGFIREVGMEKWANCFPNQLSGGMKQKVCIARCLAADTQIVLADEPTGSIDQKSTLEIMDLFKKMNEQGKTIVMVTHDLSLVTYAQRVIRLEHGHVVS